MDRKRSVAAVSEKVFFPPPRLVLDTYPLLAYRCSTDTVSYTVGIECDSDEMEDVLLSVT